MQSLKQNALPQNPKERANPFSSLCFCYTMPIFFEGRKKTLTSEDLYRALDEHRSESLCGKMALAWEKELLKINSSSKKKPSLLTATTKVFGLRFAALGLVLFLLEVVLKVIQPLFLGGLVSYYSVAHSSDELTTAYMYAIGVVACSAVNVMFMHPYMLGTMHVGMKIRVAMCGMIYRKALRLSKKALGETTAGQVVNLISNDVGRLDMATIFIHYLWIGPVETALITYLMYNEIGLASIFGVAFMLLFIPLQGWLGKKTSVLRLRTALRTDERVRLMNEIIQGIQVIKMYAWEIPFEKMVEYARKKEIRTIRQVSYIRGILLSFILFLTRVSVFMSLVGYVLLGKVLTSEKAFVITAYYNILRTTMTVFFPQGIGQLAETLVSFKRIQNYMLYSEAEIVHTPIKENVPSHNSDNGQLSKNSGDGEETQALVTSKILTDGNATFSEPGIVFSDFNAKWNTSSQEWTLNNVNLRVQPGTMCAIIGPVGAGKSSLIQAILGELKPESGSIEINGSLSYVSQEPWLFNGSVRQNILFGQEMDKKRYKTVVKKCALERDFDLLPYGDKSLVGERGTSLSGGQKARISLARAVYRKASIYLLDDPLSAVDSHVARHLFEKCMREYLRESIVILVTHQLQFLQNVDQIIIMDNGTISAVGAYDSLRESGLDFAKLLAEPEKEENSETSSQKFGSSNRLHQRHNSEISIISTVDSQFGDTPVQEQEHQETGRIGLKLYKQYFRAGGGFFYISIVIIFCVLAQALASMGDYFLSYWVSKNYEMKSVDDFNNNGSSLLLANMSNDLYINDANVTELKPNNNETLTDKNLLDIYIFTAITVATVAVTAIRSFIFFNVAMRSSTKLHNNMFRGVTRAAMYFFNINPSGRILNRFSKDMGQVDEILPSVMMDVIQIFLSLFGIVAVLAVVNPLFLVPTAILGVIFYFIRSFYLKTSRDVKRLEAITRSPLYSHLAASLTGLSTIRSYGAEDILIAEFDNLQDMHSSAFYMFISTSRAFGYWLDCFCVLYIAMVTLSFFMFSPKNGGDVGLAITQAMGMTGMVQWGMRQSAELENNMTAVERVIEYDKIAAEGELESAPKKKPPADWPKKGKIAFRALSLRYFPDENSAKILKSLNFEINPYEKVGIVGRTGAGKSSLINALFRLSYNEGSIFIDDYDINQIGLHDLRRKLSIIPQEPVLFSGTMRYNLDPFDEYTDVKVWQSLEEVKLKQLVTDLPNGLHTKISEGGSNFSVGQRQLVCLARAILRENKILVMDEATANVDPQTDALLQSTIRNKFENCTILTIAHRLHTVMDYDKILVMDAGEVVEYGPPYELLTESDSKVFYGMAQQTGKVTFDTLFKIAQNTYEQNRSHE